MASARSAFCGSTAEMRPRTVQCAARSVVSVRAQAEPSRRAALGMIAGAALLTKVNPSEAAYGDAANVFGKITNKSGFIPYAGDGYALLLPSKWNPSKEKDFAGVELRYEDNGDAVNNLVVIVQKSDKKSIQDFGSPDDFLKQVSYLLGSQVFTGETDSEGGFAPGRVSAASLLDIAVVNDKKGKPYYKYDLLVRTADGDEGGRHQLISASVGSDGNLYIFKAQCGDKRWFKGAKKDVVGAWDSFTVA